MKSLSKLFGSAAGKALSRAPFALSKVNPAAAIVAGGLAVAAMVPSQAVAQFAYNPVQDAGNGAVELTRPLTYLTGKRFAASPVDFKAVCRVLGRHDIKLRMLANNGAALVDVVLPLVNDVSDSFEGYFRGVSFSGRHSLQGGYTNNGNPVIQGVADGAARDASIIQYGDTDYPLPDCVRPLRDVVSAQAHYNPKLGLR